MKKHHDQSMSGSGWSAVDIATFEELTARGSLSVRVFSSGFDDSVASMSGLGWSAVEVDVEAATLIEEFTAFEILIATAGG